MGETRNECRILVERRGNFGNLDRDCRIILKWVKKEMVRKYVAPTKHRTSACAFG
jgi:hypothetical protein